MVHDARKIVYMTSVFIFLAIGAGCLLPIQAGVNASLRLALSNPMLAAITNFVVGLSLLLGYAAVIQVKLPLVLHMTKVPWWCWLGGSMGALLVFAGLMLSHRLGATTFAACIILGQLTASVVVDHFGWFGFSQHTVNIQRVLGLLLLAVGVLLVHRS